MHRTKYVLLVWGFYVYINEYVFSSFPSDINYYYYETQALCDKMIERA